MPMEKKFGTGITGSTEAPKKAEEWPAKEHIRAALYEEGINYAVKKFLQEVYKDDKKITILDAELSTINEGIDRLTEAPEEIVPILEKLLIEKDLAQKKELRKEIEKMLNPSE